MLSMSVRCRRVVRQGIVFLLCGGATVAHEEQGPHSLCPNLLLYFFFWKTITAWSHTFLFFVSVYA